MPDTNSNSRLIDWWTDDLADLGRMLFNDPDVQDLLKQISATSQATDLGGTMSLNVRIEPEDLVLRIHQPFVLKHRLLAVQQLRLACVKHGFCSGSYQPYRRVIIDSVQESVGRVGGIHPA